MVWRATSRDHYGKFRPSVGHRSARAPLLFSCFAAHELPRGRGRSSLFRPPYRPYHRASITGFGDSLFDGQEGGGNRECRARRHTDSGHGTGAGGSSFFRRNRKMKRIDCLKLLAPQIQDHLVVVTLGVTEQEWDMVKPRDGNLLLSGMGTVTPFGLGLALALPGRKVVVLESDGSLLFGLNSLATVAMQSPNNLTIIVFDNECYESIGGASSHTSAGVDLGGVAREAGIRNAITVRELEEFSLETQRRLKENELSLMVAKIEPAIADVPPRYYHLFEERNRFVRYIEETERIPVLRPTKVIRRDPTKWVKK